MHPLLLLAVAIPPADVLDVGPGEPFADIQAAVVHRARNRVPVDDHGSGGVMRPNLRHLVALSLLLVLTGCAPQVAEVSARVGKLVDRSTGYYAYTTPAGTSAVETIVIEIASAAMILEEVQLVRTDTTLVYPRWKPASAREYVVPEQLAALGGASSIAFTDAPTDTLELGYFVRRVADSKARNFEGGVFQSPRDGVGWREASKHLLSNVQGAFDEMRALAAREGGNRILETAVFWADGFAPYGNRGIYVSGRLVAFGEVIAPGDGRVE